MARTLFSWDDSGDYERTTGRGKNKRTEGRTGDVDHVKERNFATGPGSGCAVTVLAVAAPTIIGLAELARQVLT